MQGEGRPTEEEKKMVVGNNNSNRVKGKETVVVLMQKKPLMFQTTESPFPELNDEWGLSRGDPEDLLSIVRSCSKLKAGSTMSTVIREEEAVAGRDSMLQPPVVPEDGRVVEYSNAVNNEKRFMKTRCSTLADGNPKLAITDEGIHGTNSEYESLSRELLMLKRKRVSYENQHSNMTMLNKSLMGQISHAMQDEIFMKALNNMHDPEKEKLPLNHLEQQQVMLMQGHLLELQRQEQKLFIQQQQRKQLENTIKEKQKQLDDVVCKQSQQPQRTEEKEEKKKQSEEVVVVEDMASVQLMSRQPEVEPHLEMPRAVELVTIGLKLDLYSEFDADISNLFSS